MATVAAEFRDTFGFGEYITWIDAEFGMSRTTGANLLNVHKNLLASTNFVLDDSTVTRFTPSALYLLAAPDTTAEVREQAVKTAKAGKPVTHKSVKQAKAAAKPEVEHKPATPVTVRRVEVTPTTPAPVTGTTPSVTDELGTPLPTPEIREAFEHRKQFRLIYACLIQAKKDMRALMNTPAGAYLDEQEIEQRMKDARNLVTTYTMPYAVCPFCQGAAEKCKGCKQTGWMPEKVYESLKGAAGVTK